MEPLWSPAGATSGNRWQIAVQRNHENKPNPLPPAATGCLRRSMVSRASAVGCHPLREVPSLRRRGSIPLGNRRASLLLSALRAWALVTSAAGACLDHACMRSALAQCDAGKSQQRVALGRRRRQKLNANAGHEQREVELEARRLGVRPFKRQVPHSPAQRVAGHHSTKQGRRIAPNTPRAESTTRTARRRRRR
jgi:hypothetical protein